MLSTNTHWGNRLKWTHSDLPLPDPTLAAAALLASLFLYQSVQIVPMGKVGVVPPNGNEIVPPGFHIAAPWSPRLEHYSTQQQSVRFQTRLLDSKNLKVFVTLIVQFELQDPKLFLQKQEESPIQLQSLLDDPRVWFQQKYHDGPTKLRTLVTQQAQDVLSQVLAKENTLQVHFGAGGRSILELGTTLTEELQKRESLAGIRIHRVIVDQLEFPHWAVDQVDQRLRKILTLEKLQDLRWRERMELQRRAKEKLRLYIQTELEKDIENDANK